MTPSGAAPTEAVMVGFDELQWTPVMQPAFRSQPYGEIR
jgi:hypothetical protein